MNPKILEKEIPATMRAFVLMGHGDINNLVFHKDWPTPKPKKSEVLLKVHACGLNNTDVNTRLGWYSKAVSEATTGDGYAEIDNADSSWGGMAITFPRIQGADVCATVVGLGVDAPLELLGKRVLIDVCIRDWDDPLDINKCHYFGSEMNGGFAEYTVADARNVHPITSDLTDAELASFPTSYITAENILNRANANVGDIILITGASGGVGSALIQLAKRRGVKTVALASEEKHAGLLQLGKKYGADLLLPRKPEDLKAALRATIGRETVSIVADVVGGDYFSTVIDVLERGGRYSCSGAIAGPIVSFDLRTFYLRDLTFTGATIMPPGVFAHLVNYIENGEVKPIIAETYPLEELHQAQQSFIAKKHVGNIVVTL